MPPRNRKAPGKKGPIVQVSRDFTFDSAHRLEEYRGKCESLHGHTYRLRVTLEAPIGPDGIAFDFCELKRLVDERVIESLDHRYLNEVLPQPTAENLAVWAWERLADLPLFEVRVWETPTSFATYTGPRRR